MHYSAYDAAIDHALNRLAAELPTHLTYHNLFHTQQDVLPAARSLAAACGLCHERTRLVEVAAVFHDIGFVQQYDHHERAGIRIAERVLPEFGFDASQISSVTGMIRATQIPQSPRNLMEAILADADLDVLGRPDFFKRNACLRREVEILVAPVTDRAWYLNQLQFLEEHQYFTAPARTQHGAGKRANVDEMRRLLKHLDHANKIRSNGFRPADPM